MTKIIRSDGRLHNQLRNLKLTRGVSRFAEGSALVEFGYTKLLITATIEESVPPFLKKSGRGWVTAEYGMLPRSTDKRMDRARLLDDGRIKEIQRLIGRSLRSIVNFAALGERQVKIDCDVIEADGGTRTAAITGAYSALYDALKHAQSIELISEFPIKEQIIAVSAGIVNDEPMLDLCYEEDSKAALDANFVLTKDGRIVEIQASGEQRPFSEQEFQQLFQLAKGAIPALVALQDTGQ